MPELKHERRGLTGASAGSEVWAASTSEYTPSFPCGQSLLDSALFWLSLGAALIPCQPNTKHQVSGFGAYGRRVTTKTEARDWFADRRANLALATGGGLLALDFDRWQDFATFAKCHPYLCETLTEQTARGGVHLYYLCAQADRLRSGPTPGEFEVKSSGGVVLAAPSIVAGVKYTTVTPPPVMRRDDLADLFELSLISETKVNILRGESNGDLVARCKHSLDILALAQDLQRQRGVPVVWKHNPTGEWWYSQCPFHGPESHPSFMLNVSKGFYKCRSCGERGDCLNLYQLVNGLPDVQSAIAAVAVKLPVGGRT
jgi:hypothetical protein